MAVVAAFLIPGSPLPYVARDNPPWAALAAAMEAAGTSLAALEPDTIAIYSTQWMAVLDQLWQVRAHVSGVHVDENWHEYGDLPFDMRIDVELTTAAIARTQEFKIRSKGVDFDGFPIDTGSIVAANFLNPDKRAHLLITANNLYHDWDITHALGRVVAEEAQRLDRRVAIVGVGGLSGSYFRGVIEPRTDHIATREDDDWNRRIVELMTHGDVGELQRICPEYIAATRADMGFKHFGFILGALNDAFAGATVHGYGPLYGAGGAVVEFKL